MLFYLVAVEVRRISEEIDPRYRDVASSPNKTGDLKVKLLDDFLILLHYVRIRSPQEGIDFYIAKLQILNDSCSSYRKHISARYPTLTATQNLLSLT